MLVLEGRTGNWTALGARNLPCVFVARSQLGSLRTSPNVHRNELVNFSKLVGRFFNEIKECALISQARLNRLGTSEVRQCWSTGSLSSSVTFPVLAKYNLNKLRNPCQRPGRWSIF